MATDDQRESRIAQLRRRARERRLRLLAQRRTTRESRKAFAAVSPLNQLLRSQQERPEGGVRGGTRGILPTLEAAFPTEEELGKAATRVGTVPGGMARAGRTVIGKPLAFINERVLGRLPLVGGTFERAGKGLREVIGRQEQAEEEVRPSVFLPNRILSDVAKFALEFETARSLPGVGRLLQRGPTTAKTAAGRIAQRGLTEGAQFAAFEQGLSLLEGETLEEAATRARFGFVAGAVLGGAAKGVGEFIGRGGAERLARLTQLRNRRIAEQNLQEAAQLRQKVQPKIRQLGETEALIRGRTQVSEVEVSSLRDPSMVSLEEIASSSNEQLVARVEAALEADKKILTRLFGVDGAKKYNRLLAQENSMDVARADRASAQREAMENTLSKEQRDLLFGIGGPEGVAGEELRPFLREVESNTRRQLEDESKELLLNTVVRELTQANPASNPTSMVRLRGAIAELTRRGVRVESVLDESLVARSRALGVSEADLRELLAGRIRDLQRGRVGGLAGRPLAPKRLPPPVEVGTATEEANLQLVAKLEKELSRLEAVDAKAATKLQATMDRADATIKRLEGEIRGPAAQFGIGSAVRALPGVQTSRTRGLITQATNRANKAELALRDLAEEGRHAGIRERLAIAQGEQGLDIGAELFQPEGFGTLAAEAGVLDAPNIGRGIKAFIRRNLTSRGDLPKKVHDRMIQRDGGVGVTERQIAFTLRDFRKAQRKVYGLGRSIPDNDLVALDRALKCR